MKPFGVHMTPSDDDQRVRRTKALSFVLGFCADNIKQNSGDCRSSRRFFDNPYGRRIQDAGAERAFYGQGCYFAELVQLLRRTESSRVALISEGLRFGAPDFMLRLDSTASYSWSRNYLCISALVYILSESRFSTCPWFDDGIMCAPSVHPIDRL